MVMRYRVWILPLVACLAAMVAIGGELKEDAPSASKPASGDITGTLRGAREVKSLTACSRATGKTYQPASFDRDSGKFVFKDLPGAARYDLCLLLDDGRRIEGIDLDFVDSRMLALAAQRRKELGIPPEETHSFCRQDADSLIDFVTKLDDFMELRRPLYIQGHGMRATMLVELMRTREFYASAGKIVWRVELWYFEYRHGGWEKLANQERVLVRERLDVDAWKKISLEYYPELSAGIDAKGMSTPVEFTIPEKADAARGRPAGSKPEQTTKPFLSGLDEATSESRPAQGD